MARTAIDVFSVGLNSSVAVTPTAIDPTNDMSLTIARDDLTLIVTNAHETDPLTCTLKAVNGQGDLAVAVAAGVTKAIGNIESARFKKADGTIDVDFGVGATGTIFAVKDAV